MINKVKSITVVTGNYPAKNHQMYVFVQQLVHAFIDIGVKVSVVAPQSIIHSLVHKKNIFPRHCKGITEKGIEYDIYRPYTLSFGNCKLFKKITSWYNKKIVVSKVRNIKSEILYTHFWASALLVYKHARLNNIPLFVACGEGDDALENIVNSLSKQDVKELTASVKGVISVSTENKRKCIKYGLSNENNIDVFPNCVNTNVFKKTNSDILQNQLGIHKDDFVICFIGVFTPRKGPDRLAKAITKLNDPKIKVMFIGKSFPGYAYNFDCPGIIHIGPIPHENLPDYLNCADIFVLPTQKEGCCNAIVEALAVGLPVISSNGAFNDDILDEYNSIRLDPNNVDAIATAIKDLKDNRVLYEQMSSYSKMNHYKYSIEGRAYRILDFINNHK